jgi:nitrilase
MSAIVKAAAVQISPVLYSRQGTIEKVVNKIRELGNQGVQFATFPETVVPYYPYFSFVQTPLQMIAGTEHLMLLDQAVTVPSLATDAISEAARQAGVVLSVGVNERDGGTLYNTQLLFDADGTLIQRRRKISPTYHERMIWGQGDGSGLRAVDSKVGRIGQLACWEHYNPLARYAMMADGEQIHSAMYPGSIFGDLFSEQTQVNIRQHALAGSGPASANRQGHWRQYRPNIGRVLYRDRGPRWKLARRAHPLRRRRGDRRSRLHADRQTQAIDGLARSLQPAGLAQSPDRP